MMGVLREVLLSYVSIANATSECNTYITGKGGKGGKKERGEEGMIGDTMITCVRSVVRPSS